MLSTECICSLSFRSIMLAQTCILCIYHRRHTFTLCGTVTSSLPFFHPHFLSFSFFGFREVFSMHVMQDMAARWMNSNWLCVISGKRASGQKHEEITVIESVCVWCKLGVINTICHKLLFQWSYQQASSDENATNTKMKWRQHPR